MDALPNLLKMVAAHLREHGFDGLFNDDIECACGVDDLMPCGEPSPECVAGFRCDCKPGSEYDFRIGPTKEEACRGCNDDESVW